MLKEQLDIENVEIDRAHRTWRKNRNKLRAIVCKLLQFKDKTFWEKPNFWKEQTYLLMKIIAKTLLSTERNCGKKSKFNEAKEK